MSRKYIFTRRFFNLSPGDQVAVVDAALHDLESALGQVRPADRQSIRRTIRRIEQKTVQFGVYHSPEEVAEQIRPRGQKKVQ